MVIILPPPIAIVENILGNQKRILKCLDFLKNEYLHCFESKKIKTAFESSCCLIFPVGIWNSCFISVCEKYELVKPEDGNVPYASKYLINE